jgi:putative iron-regulated protein
MIKRWVPILLWGVIVTGCSRQPSGDSTPRIVSEQVQVTEVAEEDPLDAQKREVVENYTAVVFASYTDALTGGERLLAALKALAAAPSEEALVAAREAWKASRPPYLQTEAFRFYGGPIENEEDGPEGLLNAWPMDEAYVDYVVGDESAGVINDSERYPEITTGLVRELNEKDGEANISAGYHAIEFLLWGQDMNPDGPGNRPVNDFVESPDGAGKNAKRRGAYLVAAGELLVENLRQLADAWDPAKAGNYREAFLALPPDEALGKIFTGLGMLSGFEVSGERLTVAYETKEQEDEHSCFSDNTHVDMIEDARGIQNVYLGRYVRTDGAVVEGKGLKDLVAAKDEALAARLEAEIAASLAAAEALPVPFDRAIQGPDGSPERTAIKRLIDDLLAQAQTLVTAAKALGLTISIEGEE